ncbi:hypothetical protein SMD11_3175 [Streptomyces albireticuli]|uniref:DUF4232 domain-containing protein n=1 Tax=Streptomyces albireticuli TaxID=1940 RepID=A0A1Z2L3F2_9ACTN|nr:hypothetical protein [Streptomyces albireticuli]ARZ68817.1 hypothetical protein SMD11_3175 [Streptomyces albireticuli]
MNQQHSDGRRPEDGSSGPSRPGVPGLSGVPGPFGPGDAAGGSGSADPSSGPSDPFVPSDPSGSSDPSGPAGLSGPADLGSAGLSSLSGVDEQALRRLFQGAVEELEPSPDALEQLRRAVPARRARRRQAFIGAAAALILGGTALPALLHVASTDDGADEQRTTTASSRRSEDEGGDGRGDGLTEAGRPEEKDSGSQDSPGEERKEESRRGNEPKPSGTPSSSLPDPTNTFAAVSPTCDRDQLGQGAGTVGAADRDGRVYGAFRVVNVSRTVCTVAGPGTVAASARGSAEPSRVSVVDHTQGDAATGLPSPAVEPSEVILQPGQAYEVKFAWIPSSDGGTNGCAKNTGPASPAPSASAAPAAGAAAEQTPGVTENTPPPKPPGSVVVSHTPDVGEPAIADAKIDDACAGTVYRTGPMAVPAR